MITFSRFSSLLTILSTSATNLLCNAIEEGLDIPEMDNAIFFSNFSSGSRKIIQRAGRTMRLLPGKEVSIYVLYAVDTKEEENLEGIEKILGVD